MIIMHEKIIKLDEQTINLIAAGEVVENPTSIVKELLENSIDAKSKSIVVEIKNGGKEYIRVTDDGHGIEEQDMELAFLRHTTSKITKFEDFDTLYTNGFRGEALGSIAAVSKITTVSKRKENLFGVHMVLEGGDIQKIERTGAKDGTTVIVEDLFYNTPARKKFLKSSQAETAKITDIIIHLALANPQIKFKYINNSKVMLTTVGNHSLQDTVRAIFPEDFEDGWIPVDEVHDSVKIQGYTTHNTMMFSSRRYQYLFVNNRVIRSKELTAVLEDVYDPFIPAGNFPGFILNILVHPSIVDVNIHPNKLDIKFDKDSNVLQSITHVLTEILNRQVMIPKIFTKNKEDKKEPFIENIAIEDLLKQEVPLNSVRQPESDSLPIISYQEESIKKNYLLEPMEQPNPFLVQESESGSQEHFLKPSAEEQHLDTEITYRVDFDYRKAKIIGVIFDTYFIAEFNQSMYLIDQHAAHERILYEKYLFALTNQKWNTQTLLLPLRIKIPLILFGQEDEIAQKLNTFGFSAEVFGESIIAVRGIPTIFSIEQSQLFISEMLNIHTGDVRKISLLNDAMAMKACKAAIKAHDKLEQSEIHTILTQLDLCENKYACPHGRPIIVEISKYEIEKMFKRVLK